MSYDVQIVADSVGPNGARLTTFALRYPRFIHAEFMTHRVFSRNASSTRAIPTAKLIEWVEKDTARPVYWGKNQKGMQSTEELPEVNRFMAELQWRSALNGAIAAATNLVSLGVHKQIAGRLLEPFAHINVVVTATSYDNFFALRCHKDAMPEIQVLAVRMARLYRDSTPDKLEAGWWHLPFVTDDELAVLGEARENGDAGASVLIANRLKASVARCARVSYKTFEGKEPSLVDDIALHDRLLTSRHMSPFEHQAMAISSASCKGGNFRGWAQYRKVLPFDAHQRFDFSALEQFGDKDFVV